MQLCKYSLLFTCLLVAFCFTSFSTGKDEIHGLAYRKEIHQKDNLPNVRTHPTVAYTEVNASTYEKIKKLESAKKLHSSETILDNLNLSIRPHHKSYNLAHPPLPQQEFNGHDNVLHLNRESPPEVNPQVYFLEKNNNGQNEDNLFDRERYHENVRHDRQEFADRFADIQKNAPLDDTIIFNDNHRKKEKARWRKALSKPSISLRRDSVLSEDNVYALKHPIDIKLLIPYAPTPYKGSPWPMPQVYLTEDLVYRIKPSFLKFLITGESCDILRLAIKRIKRNIFGLNFNVSDISDEGEEEEDVELIKKQDGSNKNEYYSQNAVLRHVNVTVFKECDEHPSLKMDESYNLSVKKSGVILIAREVWGALRGLETFSQLVHQDMNGHFFVNHTMIDDFPRFPHRGVMIDTARHYITKDIIIEQLEAMAQNKMNVLHWHMTDDQSFPFQSKTYPNLTYFGAYEPTTHIYTHSDISDILMEARLRGIRVIPEFDTPGHTMSWGYGVPHLLTPCYNYLKYPNGFFGPINPVLKSTYTFLEDLFREIMELFPDKYLHLGGDEVPFDCWTSNPQLENFMRKNNLNMVEDLLSLYEKKLLDIVSELGTSRPQGSGYIVWQEVVDNGVKVKPDTIVQVWKGDAGDVERIANMGLRVLFSSCWYLDHIKYGMDWQEIYQCEQFFNRLPYYNVKNFSLIVGGEVALWTEYADSDSIISRIWPRASAAAERLWSSERINDPDEAATRMEEQRCRMKRRGIRAGVASGPGFCPKYKTDFKKSNRFMKFWYNMQSSSFGQNSDLSMANMYQVDVRELYLIPVVIVCVLICLTMMALYKHKPEPYRMIALLPIRYSFSPRYLRKILYVFLIFTVIWSIWTAILGHNTILRDYS